MRRRLSLNERANVLLLHSCEKRRKKRKKDNFQNKSYKLETDPFSRYFSTFHPSDIQLSFGKLENICRFMVGQL